MVEVRLMKRQDRSYYYEVLVSSATRRRPQLKVKGILEAPTSAQQVGVLAGALAEILCERYDDRLEPSEVAHAAANTFSELPPTPVALLGDELPRERDSAIAASLAKRR